jgi:zinc protease
MNLHFVSRLAVVLGLALPPASVARAAALHLPPVTRAKLGNGLTVFIVPTDRLPLIDLRLVVRAGSVDDPVGKDGIAALTADLLTQGAGARDARQVADAIAFVGGSLEAAAGKEQITVTCEVLKKDFGTGLELFRDAIVSPTFPPEEFERKKDEALGEIASDRNDPGTVADLNLGPFLLGDSPLAHPVVGTQKTVEVLTREDVVAFHARHVRPDNALLAVVGDVEPKAVVSALERAFASWKPSGDRHASAYAPVPQSKGRQVLIINKPEVTQTQVRLACIGVPRNHPDFYPIQVANTILGGGFTSRLVNEVRVNQGLTYGIGSRFTMFRGAGTYGIATFTRNQTIRRIIDAALEQVRKLQDEGPTEAELAKAQRYLTGQFPLQLQAPDALAARILDVEFYGLEPDYLETFRDRIEAVTMGDVRRALKSYFCLDDLRILVVSNPEVARPQLEGLGPITVGNPL